MFFSARKSWIEGFYVDSLILQKKGFFYSNDFSKYHWHKSILLSNLLIFLSSLKSHSSLRFLWFLSAWETRTESFCRFVDLKIRLWFSFLMILVSTSLGHVQRTYTILIYIESLELMISVFSDRIKFYI